MSQSRDFDPRERPLNDVARGIMVQSNYDPHFSGIEDRVLMETKLFLARWDALHSHLFPKRAEPVGAALPAPIPMILFCPNCGLQHIDKPNASIGWTNPPHRSHQCGYCNHIWRPADVPTIGVVDIITLGKADTPNPIRRTIDRAARFAPQWRHRQRGSYYVELGRGELQSSVQPLTLTEGVRLIAYKGDDNRVWFRTETEFNDGRFERI